MRTCKPRDQHMHNTHARVQAGLAREVQSLSAALQALASSSSSPAPAPAAPEAGSGGGLPGQSAGSAESAIAMADPAMAKPAASTAVAVEAAAFMKRQQLLELHAHARLKHVDAQVAAADLRHRARYVVVVVVCVGGEKAG